MIIPCPLPFSKEDMVIEMFSEGGPDKVMSFFDVVRPAASVGDVFEIGGLRFVVFGVTEYLAKYAAIESEDIYDAVRAYVMRRNVPDDGRIFMLNCCLAREEDYGAA